MTALFAPQILTSDGQTLYDDGRVLGSIELWTDGARKGVTIYEWASTDVGMGHTVEALRWLRGHFEIIVASGIGSVEDGVGDIATVYWDHMRSKGLVDTLILDDGTELARDWQQAIPAPGA